MDFGQDHDFGKENEINKTLLTQYFDVVLCMKQNQRNEAKKT